MKIMREEGFGIDCSSYAELVIAEKLGMSGDEIMFTSNDTPAYEYKKAIELGAIINLDDIFAHRIPRKKCWFTIVGLLPL